VVVQFRTPSSNIDCIFSTEATLGGGTSAATSWAAWSPSLRAAAVTSTRPGTSSALAAARRSSAPAIPPWTGAPGRCATARSSHAAASPARRRRTACVAATAAATASSSAARTPTGSSPLRR